MENKMLDDPNRKYVPKKEFITYSVSALGQGMIYAIMSSYISDFYLNVLRVTPIFVLLLMFLARIWDAINDPLMGMIMDAHEPKHGKMLTYIIATPIPIALLTLSLFYAPNISMTAKMIYASVTYVLWGMIYTMSDVPFWSLPNAMTPNPSERGSILSIARTTNGIGSAVPMAIFMILGFVLPSLTGLSGLALEKTKYMSIALVASIIGNLLFVMTYFKVKERVKIPKPSKRKKGEPSSLKLIFKCKPLMLVVIMGILASGRYMYQAAAIHVARYSFYIGKDITGLSPEEARNRLERYGENKLAEGRKKTALEVFTVEYIACKYGVCRGDGCRYVRGNAYSSEAYQKSVLQKAYSRFLHTRLCFEFYHILYRLQSFLGVYTVCYSFLRSVRSYKLRIFRNGRRLP